MNVINPPHPTPPHPDPMIKTCKTLVRFSTRRHKHILSIIHLYFHYHIIVRLSSIITPSIIFLGSHIIYLIFPYHSSIIIHLLPSIILTMMINYYIDGTIYDYHPLSIKFNVSSTSTGRPEPRLRPFFHPRRGGSGAPSRWMGTLCGERWGRSRRKMAIFP